MLYDVARKWICVAAAVLLGASAVVLPVWMLIWILRIADRALMGWIGW